VTEAFLFAAKHADFALQNAGGLSMNTAFTLLPFTNAPVETNLTGAEVVAAREDVVADYQDLKQSNGARPDAAGLRWDVDMSKAKGQRFTNVQVRNKTTGTWSTIDTNKSYVLAKGTLARPARSDYSHQIVVTAAGIALP
jgi:5'-nucleotidase